MKNPIDEGHTPEYPQIDRRDGRLFFTCGENDRGAIATSIERLIDLLDAMEDDPDLEPYLAGESWTGNDDREDESDLLEDGADTEPNGDDADYTHAEDEFGSYGSDLWEFRSEPGPLFLRIERAY